MLVHASHYLNGRDAFTVPFREFQAARLYIADSRLSDEFWESLDAAKLIGSRRQLARRMYLCRLGVWDGTI